MKVVCVVDKEKTALDRLAQGVAEYHKNIDYHVIAVHPKRPDAKQLQDFEKLARTADIIDYQYFRTAETLRDRFEWLKDIPSILTHNNPYSITESDWNSYDVVVANNNTIFNNLKNITHSKLELVPIVVDPLFWKFNDDYHFDPNNRSVIMVANRIESKKGILPVAQACKKIGIKMYLVGAISNFDYFQEVMATGVVEFAQEVTDEQLRELYYKASIHVCNSQDNFESGTMPILESIFCGVPVLTREIGHVPDFKEDGNLVIQDSTPDNVDRIAELLEDMLSDKKKLEEMRHNAWYSIKDRNFERRAYKYQRIYRSLLGKDPVSVIVPVAGKPEITKKCINSILNQTHKNVEIIVVDDGEETQHDTIQSLRNMSNVPFRYITTDGEGYNLAKARNLGAIEATSDILVFADQRMILEPNAIEEFLKELQEKRWLYGSKGVKKDFVENFSCIYRSEFFTLGGFNERIDKYGGMSQECRARARRQGFNTFYVEGAKAKPEGKSRNKWVKRYEIMEMKNKLWKMDLQ